METKDIVSNKDIHEIETAWMGDMHFASRVQGHTIHMDKLPAHGGNDKGPRPKPLILTAASGCTGMEIMVVLKKMRVKIDSLDIVVSGELSEGHPKVYTSVNIQYTIGCSETDREKIEKAIRLVEEKYCGIVSMIRHFAKFSSEVIFK
jgi:putative redox protein